MDLVRESRFKNSFIFKYSERPGTKSVGLYPDDVPEDVKKRRNNQLLAVQDAISEEDNQPLVGRHVEVLVEGPSKTAKKHGEGGDVLQLMGTHALRSNCRVRRQPPANRPALGRGESTIPTRSRCSAA